MTWKTTAVMSGVGLIATWLASVPSGPARAPLALPPEVAPVAAVVSPIEEQAARLARGLDYEARFGEPSRNPFRFGAAAAAPDVAGPVAPPVADIVALAAPPPPLLTLAGMATDLVEGEPVRTAIISGPAGVVLAGVGDIVAGGYRVRAIEADSVELAGEDEGVTLTLLLRP